MRKYLFCIILAIALNGAYSQEARAEKGEASGTALAFEDLSANIVQFVQLDIMATQGLFKTAEGIATMEPFSVNLDPFYRDVLFNKYRKSLASPITINVLTGGLGSILQGDIIGGIVLQAIMVASYSTVVLSLSNILPQNTGLLVAEISGGIGFVGGIVLPILYARGWNAKLSKALSK